MHDMTSITVSDISTEMLLLRNEHFIFKMIQGKIFIICYILGRHIEKYARRSDLTGKNQAGPTMFSAYWSESPVKICSLSVRQTVSLKVDLSCNSMFISLNKLFL